MSTTYKTEGTVSDGGALTIQGVPFPPGERVEVTIRVTGVPRPTAERYPLRGTTYRYQAPTEPVDSGDWDAAA